MSSNPDWHWSTGGVTHVGVAPGARPTPWGGWAYPYQHGKPSPPTDLVAEAECNIRGGHCYHPKYQDNSWTSTLPVETRVLEVCKHCGKRRYAVRQEEYRYEYPDDEAPAR